MIIFITLFALAGVGVLAWAVISAPKIAPPAPRPKIEPLPIKRLNKKLNDAQRIREAVAVRDRRQNGRHPRQDRPAPAVASSKPSPSPTSYDSDFGLLTAHAPYEPSSSHVDY